MDHQKIRDVAGAIQSITLAIGVFIGGLWSYHTFDATGQAQKAQEEIKRLKDRRIITINMEPEQFRIPGDTSRYISVKIHFQNVGNQTETIIWSPDCFQVDRIWIDSNNSLRSAPQRGIRIDQNSAGIWVSPGEVIQKLFLVRVDKPGLYSLRFKASTSSEVSKAAYGDGVPTNASTSWGGEAHIVIQ